MKQGTNLHVYTWSRLGGFAPARPQCSDDVLSTRPLFSYVNFAIITRMRAQCVPGLPPEGLGTTLVPLFRPCLVQADGIVATQDELK